MTIIESVADAAAAAKARRAESAAKTPSAPAYLVRRFTKAQPTQPQAAAPAPVKPAPVVAPRPAVAEAPPAPRIALPRLIDGPDSLISLVLSAEILGPPIALRQQNPWDTPGV